MNEGVPPAPALRWTWPHSRAMPLAVLSGELGALWGARVRSAVVTRNAPQFSFGT